QRLDGRGRDHGGAPPRRVPRGRAVSSGIDPDPRGQAAARQLSRPSSGRLPRGVTRVTPDSAVARLAERRDLVEHEMAAVMESILRGGATPAQVAAILLGLREKGETVAELVGAARTLRAQGVRLPGAPPGAVDTCGTGGDGARTFNVSTAAALVVAAAGVPVAKHGNRAASSSAGSAVVPGGRGGVIGLDPGILARCLGEVGIACLYAPAFPPALRRVAAVRRELGVRTLFNVLGPLVNPAGVRRQVVGVGDPLLLEPVARVLAELGAEHAWVVHGAGGLDELGLEGASDVMELSARGTRRLPIPPRDPRVGPSPHAPVRVGPPPPAAARPPARP